MSTSSPGRFIWYELMTTDTTAAIRFYTELIGWTTQPFGEAEAGKERYQMWVGAQGPLGGVVTLPERARAMGAVPHWMAHVEVADAAAAVAKVRALGGTVLVDPVDIPTVGRFAVIADPFGASLSAFEPAGEMRGHDRTRPGEFTWSELMTSDAEGSLRFYGELFGWTQTGSFDMGPMGLYRMFGQGETTYGGMFTKSPDAPTPPMWIYYIHVEDLDAALARATERGAKVLNGPMEVPGGERVVQLMDPQGVMIALHGDALKSGA
jgi:predicted enzyme related to lactoylglutathione lyase